MSKTRNVIEGNKHTAMKIIDGYIGAAILDEGIKGFFIVPAKDKDKGIFVDCKQELPWIVGLSKTLLRLLECLQEMSNRPDQKEDYRGLLYLKFEKLQENSIGKENEVTIRAAVLWKYAVIMLPELEYMEGGNVDIEIRRV
jgi:hypothetical protein